MVGSETGSAKSNGRTRADLMALSISVEYTDILFHLGLSQGVASRDRLRPVSLPHSMTMIKLFLRILEIWTY